MSAQGRWPRDPARGDAGKASLSCWARSASEHGPSIVAHRLPALVLHSLSTLPSTYGEAARSFCLSIIADVYGHGYAPDWHEDLDSITSADERGWYSPRRGGDLLVTLDADGDILACGGFYPITNKRPLVTRLAPRYGDGEGVVQVARVYVRSAHRHMGIGTALGGAIVAAAKRAGCRTLYLHAASHEPGVLAFWVRQGYSAFGEIEYPTAQSGRERAVEFDRHV